MAESLVDGKACDTVPVSDRGLLYGDHLFETIAFVAGRSPLWERHMDRLASDAAKLRIPVPDAQCLAEECAQLVGDRARAVVRITLTRGTGGRAYEPMAEPEPRRILVRRPWPESVFRDRRDGLALHTSPVRLAVGGALAGIKHGNRLEQVLAAEAARRDDVGEAVLLDGDGSAVEGIAGNLIFGLEGGFFTPPLDRAGVAGVGLSWLRDCLDGRPGEALAQRRVGARELGRVDSVMVINSVAGIRPATSLDGRPLAIPEACRRWQTLWDELFACEN